jgi:PAS domain S-box-containing protein
MLCRQDERHAGRVLQLDAGKHRDSRMAKGDYNEEFYRLLFVNNPLPMWVFDLESGRFMAVNAQACRHYGYDEAEFLGMTIADIRPPEDVARLDSIRSLGPAGHRTVGHWRHVRKDGEVFDVEITSDDIVFQGRPARIVLANDITSKMRSDAALRARDERMRYVARATNEAVWDWTIADDTIWWDGSLSRLFGLTPEALRDYDRWLARIHPGDRERVDAGLRTAIEGDGEQWSSEHRFARSDGSHAWVWDRGFVIRDAAGCAVRMVGAMTDLSERRASEERLREQATLLDGAKDAILVCDLDGLLRYWNKAAARMYALGKDSTDAGDSVNRLPDDPGIQHSFEQVLAHGEWSGRVQRSAAGREFMVDSHWMLLRAEDGRPTGILMICTDVSERVDLEQRLAQSQKLESIGQLTGGIAHDFNNLLTVIIGNAEMLADELGADPRLAPFARLVLSAGERGAELVKRLLAFARRQALEPQMVHPDEVIDGMRDLLRRTLGENIELEFKKCSGLPVVSIDPGQLESALLNLCINARDAMPDGGRLMIETSDVILDEAYASQRADVVAGAYVQVAVSDTGAGMTPDVAARAFDPFFTTKAKGKGTGLGLSMVYGFTKQSGGHVAIYSEAGIGTVVKLYLPRIDAPVPATMPVPVASNGGGGGETILLVEDDELVRTHAGQLLRQLGYRVLSASGGPEALDILRANPDIDLLFTDVIMPGGMNGPQLAEAAHRERPRLPVLYTSGYTENAIVHHGRVDPGVNLLHKPYRRETLAAKIRAALDVPAETGIRADA